MMLSWLEGPGDPPCGPADLAACGVHYLYLSTDPARYEGELTRLRQERGYVARDEVALSPETEGLESLLGKFLDEHHHTDDEVRFVLAGEGIFDIRSVDDRWMRVVVQPGDLLVVPAHRPHRFLLTAPRAIRCVRLFRDRSGWVPVYRNPAPTPSQG